MTETRIKISNLIENQLPQYVVDEFPLVSEFLSQYYTSLENQSGVNDILQNIDQYVKVDNLTNLVESSVLVSDVTFFDSTINVESTNGFPDSYGLILIDSEIITYTSKTSTTFEGCIRGFSGVTSYREKNDELTFNKTEAAEHIAIVNDVQTKVINLSVVFLKEFLRKVKKQITPGFEDRELYSELNERLFIKQAIDFYSSKGTDNSFKILFGALYGESVEVIRPRDFLIEPSSAQYRITADLIVESIEGNPEDLINTTLYQDKSENTNQAQGTITKIEKIRRNDKDYYIIGLDYDYDKDILPIGTVYGDFKIHPKTRSLTRTSIGNNTIDVDSTVAFPRTNGRVIVYLDNGTSLSITYKSKTLNQFLDCEGITQNIPTNSEIILDEYAYGYDKNDQQVKVRILGVLSDLNIPENNFLYGEGDPIKIKYLGSELKDFKANNWFFNIPVTYEVSFARAISLSLCEIGTYDTNSFRIGDSVILTVPEISSLEIEEDVDFSEINGIIEEIIDEKTFKVRLDSFNDFIMEKIPSTTKVLKNILRPFSNKYTTVNKYIADVQNVYHENSGNLYVSSSSLPSYFNESNNQALDASSYLDRSIVFEVNSIGIATSIFNSIRNHNFYTGDSVVYRPSDELNELVGIETGVYFVKKVDDNKFKLARSRNNIFQEKYVTVTGITTNSTLELKNFTYRDFSSQLLESQKIIRKISEPENDGNVYETEPGLTGIFINGVELLNYKSKDNVYYGPIQSIVPTSPGIGYDVINPPVLSITDTDPSGKTLGSGAIGHCSIIGALERVETIDPGFDYIEDPKIEITGGNGFGASAVAKLASFEHQVAFNSEQVADLVNLNPTNTISFSEYHRFRDFEEVIYITDGQTSVGGLSTNSSYYVSVQDEYTVKLYKSKSDAISNINTIRLTSFGVGNHAFKAKNKKKKIGSVVVTNKGTNYQNKLTTTTSVGINTSTDTIYLPNHGYESGEIVKYTTTGSVIGGLSTSTSYFVTKIDENNIKLSILGQSSSGVTTSFYYETKQYVNLTSKGSGVHKFNYPEIKLTITGRVGVSTFTGQDYRAVLRPIFRGEIQSVYVQSGGSGYGAEDILNYNRQPLFQLRSGSGIELKPIVQDGKIVEVLVNNSGSGYNSIPDLKINGSGTGAILTPIFSNGTLIDVNVIYGGIGYEKNNTSIDVISAGSGAKFEAIIKSWKVNQIERLLNGVNQIDDNDGILTSGLNYNYGLQFSHGYAPRKLRSRVQRLTISNNVKKYVPDLQRIGNEVNSTAHSPIIGWAYDGNPIYGPYGHSSKTGGKIKQLKSGYELTANLNRPKGYPDGFFVEDYVFVGNGDLDEHNGRFCVTPEYPNGVYAYFSTFTLTSSDSFGGYKRPIFPYIIGNTFKSKPIDFNFDIYSNQDNIDINKTGWKRNTTPYNLSKQNSYYDQILNPDNIRKQSILVKSIESGSVSSITIKEKGENYKVGDKLVFGSIEENLRKPKAEISLISGKSVSQISVATSSISGVRFYPHKEQFIGFTENPHNFSSYDLVTFTGDYEYKKSGRIDIDQNTLVLYAPVLAPINTGNITYFNVNGNLDFPFIKENDIYKIGNEQIKILNIDKASSRVKILRNQNGTTGTAYSYGTILTEIPRKFKLNFGISTSYNFSIDKEYYFDPKETIALGTTSGVGINSTYFISLNNFNNPVSIGTGSTTFLFFKNSQDIEAYRSGGYVDIVNSSSPQFNVSKKKIIGIGETSIKIDFDSSSLSGVGVTAYVDKWNIREIPTRSIYIKDHGLKTGDLLSYSSNGGSGISASKDGIVDFNLSQNSTVYVKKITNDIIGISTTKNGDLLYFTSIGTGELHSFKTNYDNVLKGQISKNVVTVTTNEPHELSLSDSVIIDTNPGISTTIVVQYNDYNRRLIINPRNFSTIDILSNSITLKNHGYFNGQKVLYTSSSPASGLQNQKMYYVVVVDLDTIKLSSSYHDATKNNPVIVDIKSSSSGTISEINPPLDLIRNRTVIFNLSDSSLSYVKNGIRYPAFDFKFYTDENFINEFDSTKTKSLFEVSVLGRIGIDQTARVTLRVNDSITGNLYYNLVPANIKQNTTVKKEIIVDKEVSGFNKISFYPSKYNGNHTVIGLTENTFSYNLLELPESSSYSTDIKYYTNSKSAKGPIERISLINCGKKYNLLPPVTSVASTQGTDSILLSNTSSIGKVKSFDIEDIGFDYSADYSLRPTASLPNILFIDCLSTFDRIEVTSFGKNYLTPPNFIVIDGLTNKIIDDANLSYSLGDSHLTIRKNTKKLSDISPKIIPINNSNGFKIKTISFNNLTKDVTVYLDQSFSDPEDFPFKVGSKVLLEGISVGITTIGKGYNSSNYNYSLFTIVDIDPNLGGIGEIGPSIVYNLSSYLKLEEIPGNFDEIYSVGRIIPESHLLEFNPILKKNEFYKGEQVYTSSSIGIVEYNDKNAQYLKVSTSDDFFINDYITGKGSGSVAIIRDIIKNDVDCIIDYSHRSRKGWNSETGFLNRDFQRIHNSDYYQYFSYELKSKVEFNKWNDAVSTLNHASGFKKFSNLLLESNPLVGILTDQNNGDFRGTADLIGIVNWNCVTDFDLVRENNLYLEGDYKSNEITFNSRILQDYIEAIGNRVLLIDDISKDFNSDPRPTNFTVVDKFDINEVKARKYFITIQDKLLKNRQELALITLIHNNFVGFLNQYGENSIINLGFFDLTISDNIASLLFYPTRSRYNDYNLGLFSFSITNLLSDVGSVNLGDSIKISTNSLTIPKETSSSSTIVSISSTYRSSKVLVHIGSSESSYYEFNEITYIHDGSDVHFLDYGEMTTASLSSKSTLGIGTYNAYISDGAVKIDIIPHDPTNFDYEVKTISVSIANTESIGIGSTVVSGSYLTSNFVSISSTDSPSSNIIASYSNEEYNSSYCIVVSEDKTNLNYKVSEVLSLSNKTNSYTTEFGIIQTGDDVGFTTVGITTDNMTNIYFTPNEDRDIDVKVFQLNVGYKPDILRLNII